MNANIKQIANVIDTANKDHARLAKLRKSFGTFGNWLNNQGRESNLPQPVRDFVTSVRYTLGDKGGGAGRIYDDPQGQGQGGGGAGHLTRAQRRAQRRAQGDVEITPQVMRKALQRAVQMLDNTDT